MISIHTLVYWTVVYAEYPDESSSECLVNSQIYEYIDPSIFEWPWTLNKKNHFVLWIKYNGNYRSKISFKSGLNIYDNIY